MHGTKSQKLGLRASNSLGFAHWRGPFASPGWVPQKVHNCRSKELCKGLRLTVNDQDQEGSYLYSVLVQPFQTTRTYGRLLAVTSPT
jgi:hypothetical protein